jgi:hypothetical protein
MEKQNDDELNPLKIRLENLLLKEDLKSLKEHNQYLKDLVSELMSEKKDDLFTISNIKGVIDDLKRELDVNDSSNLRETIVLLKDNIRENNFYERQYKELASQIDYVYVTQFDTLLWGDNYPALKVLFNYLQKMNAISVNWSYFAHSLGQVNQDYINLHTGVLTQNDFGYLLFKIKPFFLNEFTGSRSRYFAILKRTFLLNGEILEDYFDRKKITGYETAKIPTLLKRTEIDILIQNITAKYN